MLPKLIEHTFTLDGESYRLVEWDRGGERRLKAEYAMAIAPAPGVLENIDGGNLYAEAVARECLKEAPDIFWTTRPAQAGQNGTPSRVVSLEHVPRALWEQFRAEVDRFLGLIFPAAAAELVTDLERRPSEPQRLETVENLPTVFQGRAE